MSLLREHPQACARYSRKLQQNQPLRYGAVTHANTTVPAQNSGNSSLWSLVKQIF